MYEENSNSQLNNSLITSITYGDKDHVKKLLSNGANPHFFDKNNCTPLHFACLQGNKEIVEILVTDYQVDVNSKNKFGLTPLKTAKLYKQPQLIDFLTQNGAIDDIQSQSTNPPTVIICHKPKNKIPCCTLQ